jgi:hypothetical protein
VQVLRGRAASGRQCSILQVGEGALADKLATSFFGGDFARGRAAPQAAIRLRQFLARSLARYDLVLAQIPRPLVRMMRGSGLLEVPAVVEFTIATASAVDLSRARLSLRANARRADAAGFETRVTADPAELTRFYDEFYLPMLARRFGAKGIPQSLLTLRRRLRSGGLVWLSYRGREVAGEVFDIRGDTVRLLVHGRTATGDDGLDGLVQLASDRAAIKIALGRGCRTVDLGAASPILGSGLFARKRAYGATVRPRASRTHELLVGWREAHTDVLAWLRRTPLVIGASRGLVGLGTVDADGPADPRDAAKLHRALLPDGIEWLILMAAGGWLDPSRGWTIPDPKALRLVGPLSSQAVWALAEEGPR